MNSKIKKMLSGMGAVLLLSAIAPVNANAEDIVETIPHWFGCGYQRYDGMVYDVTASEGKMTVTARCEIPYTPELLEGDYIKFGNVTYRTDEAELYFYPETFTTGNFYVEEAVNGAEHTVTIWCKHGRDGLVTGEVFNFSLVALDDEKDYTVTVFDNVYTVPHIVDGLYAGSGYYADMTEASKEVAELSAPPLPNIATPETTTLTTTIPIATTTTTVATTATSAITTTVPVTIPIATAPETVQTVIVTVPVENSEFVSLAQEMQTQMVATTVMTTTIATETEATETTSSLEEEEDEYSRFDINRDGVINLGDLSALLLILFGYE